MSDYQTMNAVPSIDPRDLDDNAKAFDRFLQSSAASEPDRLGVQRKTWHQMEEDAAALVSPNVSALAAVTPAVNMGVFFNSAGPVGMDTYTLHPFVRGISGSADQTAFRSAISAAPIESPTFTGVPAGPTATAGTNTTQFATTAFVEAAKVVLNASIALKANIASPAFTGVPTMPTAATGTNTTQGATTAFVRQEIDAQLAWTNFTLQNSWSVIASRRAVYRKILGQVQLEVQITGGTATNGTVVATLPAGFRPVSILAVPVAGAPNATPAIGTAGPRVVISTDGTISCQNVDSAAGISFSLLMPLN